MKSKIFWVGRGVQEHRNTMWIFDDKKDNKTACLCHYTGYKHSYNATVVLNRLGISLNLGQQKRYRLVEVK